MLFSVEIITRYKIAEKNRVLNGGHPVSDYKA